MSMKFTKLTTYWDASDAGAIIDFLDTLRDALWDTYGEQIIEMHRKPSEDCVLKHQPPESQLDNDIDF